MAKRRRFNFFFFSLSLLFRPHTQKKRKVGYIVFNLANSLSPFSFLFARQRETERERHTQRERDTERERQKGCFFQRQRGKDGSERLISHLLLHLLLFRLAGSFFFRMSLRRRPRNLLLLVLLLLLRAFEDFKAAAARVVVVVVVEEEEEDGIARR